LVLAQFALDDQSQRQHWVAKGVARRGDRTVIIILGVIKCQLC